MLVRLIVVVPFASILAAFGDESEVKKFQGTWSIIAAEKGGKKMPAEELKKAKVVFKDDTMTILGGKAEEKVQFRLDPGKTPKAVDLIPADPNSRPALGIYELKGDTLTFCWRRPGGERPAEFDGSQALMFVLKRDK